MAIRAPDGANKICARLQPVVVEMFNRMHGKSSKGFDVCVPDIMEYIIYHDSGTSRESDSDGDSYRS